MEDTAGVRLDILKAAAEERYKVLHIIRDRVYNTCTWCLGVFLLVAGWIVQRGTALTVRQRIFLATALLFSAIVIRVLYLRDLERGFRAQQKVVARIEDALGLYDGIYPDEWKNAGSPDGAGHFFGASHAVLYVGFGILLAAIVMHGWFF